VAGWGWAARVIARGTASSPIAAGGGERHVEHNDEARDDAF
jgi:hypothetical protein